MWPVLLNLILMYLAWYWSIFIWNRHGIRQLQTGWADGPAYVTQCPIQTGQSYVYNYTIIGQRGTLFWHAHISWLRATVYGPIIILPKRGIPYPFSKPHKEVPIIFGKVDHHNKIVKIFYSSDSSSEFANKNQHASILQESGGM